MSAPIAPVAPAPSPLHAASSSPERSAKIKQAAHDFESVLVRQLLKASKIGGESKGGYGDMAVDALADGIERGGGLGLASCIEHALARTSR